MKPVIGIGGDVVPSGSRDSAFAYTTYVEALKRAGAIPLVVPPQPENVEEVLDSLDAVLLAGGHDCDPTVYGEEPHASVHLVDARRQQNDLALARLAHARGIPTLGICLGMQMMNVARGGSLIQDIASQCEESLEHASDPANRIRHDVYVDEGTRLAEIIGSGLKNVNSSHHQAIRETGEGLRVTAHAPDGIIEGVEDASHPFYIGVQWHPEDMNGEEAASKLFARFVEAAKDHASKRQGATQT